MDGESLDLIMAIDLSNYPKTRLAVAVMAIAGTTVAGIGIHEGFRSAAYIPVPGDPPTIGFGSTRHEDGRPVKLGDKITPERALRLLTVELEGNIATPLKQCITAPLYDYEWAAYIMLAYNVGPAAVCKSANKNPKDKNGKPLPPEPDRLIDLINAQKYAEACARISDFDGKYVKNAKGEKVKVVLPGLVKRRAFERAICEGKQPSLGSY